MEYPFTISVKQARELFGICNTTVYAKIKCGDFQTLKIGRATRITFSSVINFAIRCLREGNGAGDFLEEQGTDPYCQQRKIAEELAQRLCNIHCGPDMSVSHNSSIVDDKITNLHVDAELSFSAGEL